MAFLQKCFRGSSASTVKKQPSATIEDLCHRFSLSQLRKSTYGFDESRIISNRASSVMYRACISINGQLKDLVLMQLRRRVASSSEELSLYKDNIIYRCLLHHPNLVSLVGFCDDHNELSVAYDYAPNGSLDHQLHGIESNSPTLPWKRRLEIIIGVARGLHYLHSGTKRTIIHRDIRLRTILLYENLVPKLAYFGLSLKGPKFSEKDVKPIAVDSVVGTIGYMAPECLLDVNVTCKNDAFSFGAVLLELICGETPRQIMQHHEVSHVKELCKLAETRKAGGIFDERLVGEIEAECWELYMEITESCLIEDPNERPDMGEVEVQLERILQLQEEVGANQISHAFFI